MLDKKAATIIGLQAILIVVLFWMLIFYGKDEYEDFRIEQEEEIESINRVTEKDGISTVALSPAVQQNSGIKTAQVKALSYQGEIKSFGTVVALDTLINAKTQLLNLKSALATSQTSYQQHRNQYVRLKALNADDKNVSDLAVQEALALMNYDQTMIDSKTIEINNLKSSVRLTWGKSLATLALSNQPNAMFSQLMARKNVLIQVSLPFSTPDPKNGDIVALTPLNSNNSIKASYISAATQADMNGAGKTFYYTAPANNLRIGMRVAVEMSMAKNARNNGVIIPSSAVIWYAGTPWAYFKEDHHQFIRKPISADIEVDTGWFNPSFSADSEVVVRGAQLLLSEEFKYLIKNENDD